MQRILTRLTLDLRVLTLCALMLSACTEPLLIVVTATPTTAMETPASMATDTATSSGTTAALPETAIPVPTTVVPPTFTPGNRPTSAPPTLVPTSTATPSPVSTVAPTRISFRAGERATVVRGTVANGAMDRYVLRALAGQTLSVVVSTPGSGTDGGVLLEIVGADGTPFKRFPVGGPSWSGALPATQEYVIALTPRSGSMDYAAEILVDAPAPTPTATVAATATAISTATSTATATTAATTTATTTATPVPAPQRIEFAPGATSAQAADSVTFPARNEYLLRADAGQRMSVAITSSGSPANFAISGASDGIPYKRLENEERTFTLDLPIAQDYLLTVAVPAGSAAYTLNVTIVTPPLAPAPERVEFAPGATSAVRPGTIAAGINTQSYILAASARQRMTVNVTSGGAPVDVLIAVSGSDFILAQAGGTGTGYTSITTALPLDEEYAIVLSTPLAAGDTAYTVEFIIESATVPALVRERVNFSAGDTSTVRNGTVPASSHVYEYILGGGAGQTLIVNVTSGSALIDVGVLPLSAAAPLAQASGDPSGYTGLATILPSTTDYIIRLSTPLAVGDTNYMVGFIIE